MKTAPLNIVEIPATEYNKTIETILAMAYAYAKQMTQVEFKYDRKRFKNLAQYCEYLHNWCRTHIKYTPDPFGIERIRSPYQTLRDKKQGVDCEDYVILLSCILSSNHVAHKLRVTDYDGTGWSHIYIVVADNIVLDAVSPLFGFEEPFVKKKDYPIQVGLRGIKQEKAKMRTINQIKTMKEPLIYGIERIGYEEAIRQGYINSNSLGKTPDSSAKNTYDYITEKVIKLIESSDNLPWRKPWELNSMGEPQMPTNYANKSNYRGFNVFFLHWQMTFRGHRCPYFLTFKQVEAAKGRIKKGASAYNVIFYTNDLYRHVTTKKTITKKNFEQLSPEQQSQYGPSWTLKGYNVFNAEEIEGIEFDELWKSIVLPDDRQIENCETIIENMPNRPKLGFGGNRAYYSPSGDNVQMPQIKFFKKEQEYYSTFYHELIHSTGHELRLKREFSGKFGSEKYAFEELIAEMGACYLCGESGVLYHTIKNSGAYFQSWKKAVVKELREDNKAIFKAAAEAQRAADYVLGLSDPEIYKRFSPPTPKEKPSKPISETPKGSKAPKKVKVLPIVKEKTKSKMQKAAQTVRVITHIETPEHKQISRFLAIRSKETLQLAMTAYKSLQKDITERKIRKTSEQAGLIQAIQKSYYAYLTRETTSLVLGEKWLKEAKEFVGSQKPFESVALVKRFIGWGGKAVKEKQLADFTKDAEKALKSGKESDPYADELKAILLKIKKAKAGDSLLADAVGLSGLTKNTIKVQK